QQVHRGDGTQAGRAAPGGLTAVSPACVTRRGGPSASKGRILRPVYEPPPTTPGRGEPSPRYQAAVSSRVHGRTDAASTQTSELSPVLIRLPASCRLDDRT